MCERTHDDYGNEIKPPHHEISVRINDVKISLDVDIVRNFLPKIESYCNQVEIKNKENGYVKLQTIKYP